MRSSAWFAAFPATFCLVVVLAAPTVGLPAIAVALVACVAAGWVTWRSVPLAPRVAAAR